MKAEERKHLKENEFQEWLGRAWKSITSGSTTNTIIWSVILVGLLLAIGWRYYSRTTLMGQSAVWSTLDNAGSVEALEAIIKDNKNSMPGRVARFHKTRFEMQDAMSRIAGPSYEDRAKAADALESVRDSYRELSKESVKEQPLAEEALMGLAKAEETLAAIPKADNDKEMRGSLDQAKLYYLDLASRYTKSPLGEQAANRAKALDDRKSAIDGFYKGLTSAFGKPPPPPPPPPLPEPPKPDAKGPDLPKLPEAPKAPDPKPADAPKPPDASSSNAAKADPPKPPQ